MKYTRLIHTLTAVIFSIPALAQETENSQSTWLEVVQIIGTRDEARNIAGSGALIDEDQIRIEAATDINQLLKTIPGTYVREEDGLGLRPNIGIRAAGSERSGKVTLLEDGVMIAPAPYSNPAAYYFPTTMRMSSVEVLKGAPLLRYGPQTTGGVINLISTPIPDSRSGNIMAVVGEHGTQDIHAYYGDQGDNFGWLVETVQRDSDGFKHIDRSTRDAGLDIQDYLVKLAWEGEQQRLLFKAQHSKEVSNETYLGLTDADFRQSPNRRYGLSSIDQMDNQHDGYSLTYSLNLGGATTLTTMAYHNEFARDWFKLGGGSTLISAANAGDTDAQAVLDGEADASGLEYKHNNRSYESSGIELNLATAIGEHSLEIGGRIHEDEMDRFQPVEIYDQINGSLVYQNTVQPTGGNNRIETADALSFWMTDTWQVSDALNLQAALRYEDVESSRSQYADPDRTTTPTSRSNDSSDWLPGLSLTWDLNDEWQFLTGIHKGFSPLGGGAVASEKPETSINYEAGLRFNNDQLFVEAIAFFSNFDNKTENCSLASPCSNGATSGSFLTGQAQVSGLEFQLGNQFALGNYQVPLSLSYTHTQAEISEDNPANGFVKGDQLADIPENTLSFRAGLESDFGWSNFIVAKYTDSLCDSVGCNNNPIPFGETESFIVLDLISRYDINADIQVFLKVENLFDEQAIVSRKPDGARPNKPQSVSIGMDYSF